MDEFERERRHVGSGWQALIDRLHKDLLALDPNYQVTQIKEKFGGLRYYIATSEDLDADTQWQMQALTHAAEEQSLTICEACGEPGKPTSARMWIKTYCDEHKER